VKQVDIDKWIELGVLRERERIINLLEGDKRLHSYFYAEQFIKAGASVLPFVEIHAKDCPGCDLIALIKGETE
jgi:hypothetical protein